MRIAIASILLLASSAVAQIRPVVGGGVTAFDPEISVVNSGAVLDAQAVVSHDRRYVNINMRPSNSNLLALRQFPVQGVASATGFGGFVGGADPGSAVARGDAPGADASGSLLITLSPTPAQRADPQILNRAGMIRLSGE